MRRAPLAVVAMSGGVDSSVAAGLLVERGYRVLGASLRLWDPKNPDDPKICSNARDAGSVARFLGIEHEILDERSRFSRGVLDGFARDYASGRTPNPCPACNADFKLGILLEWARSRGADVLATGHYARVLARDGAMRLLRGRDRVRDQSYFLFSLAQEQLARATFPLGDMSKEDVRATARRFALPVSEKPASQDLCLGKPAAFVASRGLGGRSGPIVDESGSILGRHHGVEGFTVGQRRGLGVATGAPRFVRGLDGPRARVMVGEHPPRSRVILARRWSWIAEARPGERLEVQVRYRHDPVPGRVVVSGVEARIELESPALAVAPGQAVVAYHGEELIGGGWIEGTVGEG